MIDNKLEIMSLKIKELYSIVNELGKCYPGRDFTADRHLKNKSDLKEIYSDSNFYRGDING